MRPRLLAAVAAAVAAAGVGAADPGPGFIEENQAWRARRLESLRSESGWLSLVGLYWLHEGENRFGSAPDGDIVLPEGMAPARAGSFFLEPGGKVRAVAAPEAGVTLGGAPLGERAELAGDDRPSPDELRLGSLRLYVIRRAGRVGIRAKSPDAPARRAFHGLDYFPPSEKYRVIARFVPAAKPRAIPIATVIGTVEPMRSPGTLELTLDGKKLRLDPVLEGDDATELFILFRDATADKETYPAGRFLYAELPRDGKVVVDFNRAYNPPCAFTDYATCPLPPRQNVLPVRVEAGEKRYGEH